MEGPRPTLGPEIDIKTWIKVLSLWLSGEQETARHLMLKMMASRLDGFAAAADMPIAMLVPELADLYPGAMVICTVRDPETWVSSVNTLSSTVTMWFLRFALFPLPSLRYFVDFANLLTNVWDKSYGEKENPTRQSYDGHIALLKRTVPKERLLFFDVKDGWEPLCKALGKEVPQGIPFPHINDTDAMEACAKNHVQRGLMRWLIIVTAAAAAIIVLMLIMRRI